MTSIYIRTIRALVVQQRLLRINPLAPDWFHDQFDTINKKIMARVCITEEAMQDSSNNVFINAMRQKMHQ